MTALRCPVCRAENTTPSQCRRCKADLSLLWRLEDQRERALMAARAALDRLRRGSDSLRLRAVTHLLRREFVAALACHRLQTENLTASLRA
jgi:hypothetical protein